MQQCLHHDLIDKGLITKKPPEGGQSALPKLTGDFASEKSFSLTWRIPSETKSE
jgi:hypothetical protein